MTSFNWNTKQHWEVSATSFLSTSAEILSLIIYLGEMMCVGESQIRIWISGTYQQPFQAGRAPFGSYFNRDWWRSRATFSSARKTGCNNSLKSSMPCHWDKTEEETGRCGFINSCHWVKQEEGRKLEGRDGTGRQKCFHRSQGHGAVCQAEVSVLHHSRGMWSTVEKLI